VTLAAHGLSVDVDATYAFKESPAAVGRVFVQQFSDEDETGHHHRR
jgi:hypothetical protein